MAVEKTPVREILKNKLAPGCHDFLNFLGILYPAFFGCFRGNGTFSTATPVYDRLDTTVMRIVRRKTNNEHTSKVKLIERVSKEHSRSTTFAGTRSHISIRRLPQESNYQWRGNPYVGTFSLNDYLQGRGAVQVR